MSGYDYDLFVLGAGSGGLATAKRAASYNAHVAIAEQDRVGGTCVIRGCIPKKLMVYAAGLGHAVEDARGYGWPCEKGELDWAMLVRKRNEAVATLERKHEEQLSRAGVELLRGRAELGGAHEIEIGGRLIRSRYVLLATGAEPVLPAVAGIDHAITSDDFFRLEQRPARVAIVGGGYIAVEFASILHGLGISVSIFIRRDLPLTAFDHDLREELCAALRSAGLDVRTQTTVREIVADQDGLSLLAEGPRGPYRFPSSQVLVYAVGRRPNSGGLGLEDAGVELAGDGGVVTDEQGMTSVPGVLAVGDVTGRKALTPVAIQAGRALADRLFGGKPSVVSYDGIPTAVFSDPPLATVGLTEAQAREAFGSERIRVFKSRFTPLVHSLTLRQVATLVKLVVDRDTDRVLGCHMVGHDAPEIIQGFAVAMKAGATKADFDATIGIHPSSAEEFVTLT